MRLTLDHSEGGPPVTIESLNAARERDLVRVLRELNDAAIAARPYVKSEADAGIVGAFGRDALAAGALLDRLDLALADAGEYLAGVTT